MNRLFFSFLLLFLLSSCSGGGSKGDGGNSRQPIGTNDGLGPKLEIVFPPTGKYTSQDTMIIRGSAIDINGLYEINLNDKPVSSFDELGDEWAVEISFSKYVIMKANKENSA